MKKVMFIAAVAALTALNGMAQEKSSNTESKSKFTEFVTRKGSVMSYEDYNSTSITTWSSGMSMKKRVVKNGKDEKVFYIFDASKEYKTRKAAIAHEDMDDIFKAIDVLKEAAKNDITTTSDYLEKFYETTDNFKIGYYIDNKKVKWYVDLDTNLSESVVFIGDIDAFIIKLKYIMK